MTNAFADVTIDYGAAGSGGGDTMPVLGGAGWRRAEKGHGTRGRSRRGSPALAAGSVDTSRFQGKNVFGAQRLQLLRVVALLLKRTT